VKKRSSTRGVEMTSIELVQVSDAYRPNGLPSKGNFDSVEVIETTKPEIGVSGFVKTRESVQKPELNGSYDTPIIASAPNFHKERGAFVSDDIFLKLIRSDYAKWLMGRHPWAYLLLNLIALRACRNLNNPDGLKIGEAFIGDHESIGATRGQYRHAITILERERAIEKVETCRNRKKATTGTTTVGTKVKLLDSRIWDINPDSNNHRNNHPTTTEQPPNNQEQEELVSISSISHTTMSPSQAQSTKVVERIFFDWNEMKLKGIEQSDIDSWKNTFSLVDVPEYLKFIETDIGAKPTKYKKRKQILRTVIIYFQNRNENLKAKKANPGFQQAKPESHHNKPFNKDERPVQYKNRFDFSGEKK
jgi:hypothetical protein